MNQRPRRAIRSREERDLEVAQPRAGAEVAPESENGAGGDLEEVRKLARSHGLVLSKERRVRRVRPDEKNGKVRLTCNVSVEVRDTMEGAKYLSGMDFSEMVNLGVAMLLESMGYRIGAAPGSVGPGYLGHGSLGGGALGPGAGRGAGRDS